MPPNEGSNASSQSVNLTGSVRNRATEGGNTDDHSFRPSSGQQAGNDHQDIKKNLNEGGGTSSNLAVNNQHNILSNEPTTYSPSSTDASVAASLPASPNDNPITKSNLKASNTPVPPSTPRPPSSVSSRLKQKKKAPTTDSGNNDTSENIKSDGRILRFDSRITLHHLPDDDESRSTMDNSSPHNSVKIVAAETPAETTELYSPNDTDNHDDVSLTIKDTSASPSLIITTDNGDNKDGDTEKTAAQLTAEALEEEKKAAHAARVKRAKKDLYSILDGKHKFLYWIGYLTSFIRGGLPAFSAVLFGMLMKRLMSIDPLTQVRELSFIMFGFGGGVFILTWINSYCWYTVGERANLELRIK